MCQHTWRMLPPGAVPPTPIYNPTVQGFGGFGDQMNRYADAMRNSVAKYKYGNGFMPPAPGWAKGGPTVGQGGPITVKIGTQIFQIDQLGPFVVLPNGRIICKITVKDGKLDSFEYCGKTDYASSTLPKAKTVGGAIKGWLPPPALM